MEKFVLVDGYVSLDNIQLFVDHKTLRRSVKQRGGWLGVFFAFVGISTYHTYKRMDALQSFFHYFDYGIRILGMLTILAIFWYLIFYKKSKRKLIINEIEVIEIDKAEFETDVCITFSNKRSLDLNFRNLENQIEPFIEALQKRNTRIKIKNS